MNREQKPGNPHARLPDAGPWLRLGAKLIDHGLWSFIEVGCIGLGAYLNAIGGPPWVIAAGPVVSLILWYLYVYRFTLTRGQTVGKMAAGIRVVGPEGSLPEPDAVLKRVLIEALFDMASVVLMAVGWAVATLLSVQKVPTFVGIGFGVGSILGLLDPVLIFLTPRRQALHDIAADTFVLRVQRAPALAWGSAGACLVAWIALPFCVMRPLFVESYVVPSGSMEPTIQVGDRILANKLMMRLRAPRRDEIVMFRAPSWIDPERRMFVKRVVGIPGDSLSVREGKLWRNRSAVEEPFVAEPMRYSWPDAQAEAHEITVPEGNVVVFGDNRNDSNDSHCWERLSSDGTHFEPAPFLPIEAVKGRLIFRFWPPDRMGTVAQEEYASE